LGIRLDSAPVDRQNVSVISNQEVQMNKTEMAMKLAKKTGVSQGKAAEIIDTMFSAQPRKGLIHQAARRPSGPEPGDWCDDHDRGQEVRSLQAGQDSSRARREVEGALPTDCRERHRASWRNGG
jgi:hypothetical protein